MYLLAKVTGTYSPPADEAGGEMQLRHWGLVLSSREAAFVLPLHMHLLPIMLQSALAFRHPLQFRAHSQEARASPPVTMATLLFPKDTSRAASSTSLIG